MEERQDNNTDLENDAENNLTDEMKDEISDAEETHLEQEAFESDDISDDEDKTIELSDSVTTEMSAEMETVSVTSEKSRTVSATSGSSTLPKLALLFGIVLALGLGLVFWKNKVAGHGDGGMTKVSKQEMELLLKDFNPMQLKQLSESPEQKQELVKNIKELLAIASQATKEGFAERPEIKDELESMESALYAMNYDKKLNEGKGPMPPFGFISEDQVKAFWGENKNTSGINWIWNGAESRRREAEFQKFINTKIDLARKSGQIAKDQEPSEEDLKQAREAFAKTQIYYLEAKAKLAKLNSLPEAERKDWKEWQEKTEFQIKLQKAQFLAQNYFQEVIGKNLEVTDADVKKYIAEHPELTNSEEKKKKAEEILKKIQDGGDFAELAKEFSEDPGSKDKGGLYEGVAKGQFAPEFEAAALALEPGKVADKVIKTDFGYHIIKLEKKGETTGANGQTQPTFDARHILISTMIKDPDNPQGQEMPAEQFVKAKLEKDKQEKALNDIKENNPIEVADFEIPEVSEEALKKMQEEQMQKMQQMQEMQQQGPQQQGPPPPPPPAEKEKPKSEKK